MKKPNLDKIIDKLKKDKNFSLSREQYLSYTGADVPQQKWYTENKSAVAIKAKEYGYIIKVIPEVLEFHKCS